LNIIPGQRTILIASRASEYKKQLVEEIQKQLSAANISHITIGVKQLDKVDPTDYAAVIVINTCLAWGLDHEVSTFLDGRKTTSNILLLTTSGDGAWLPDKNGRDFDAISGASVKANIGEVARNIMERIQKRL
jgi:predicted Zn-dependent peptidase